MLLRKVERKNKIIAVLLALILILASVPASAFAAAGSYTAYVTYKLNVRSGPSAAYSVVGILAEGSKVTVLETRDDWCRIETGAISGWCSANFLSDMTAVPQETSRDSAAAANEPTAPAPLSAMRGKCTASTLNVRSGPAMTAPVVGTLHSQSYFDILGITQDGQWYQISTGALTGYVSAQYVALVDKSSIETFSPTKFEGDSTYLVMIIKSKQIGVILEKDTSGEYTKIVRQFLVSSGKYDGYTPTGTYRISDQYQWRLMKGGVYSQYASRFAPNLLLHSVPYARMSASSLYTYQYNMLGQPASSGCVRMRVEDCKWIFDNCAPGTIVKIVDDAELEGLDENIVYEYLPAGVTWDPTDDKTENPYFGLYD